MAQDRVFDATLVIDPHEVLLQQGYLWTVSGLLTIPKGKSITLTWEVPDVQAHLHFAFTQDSNIEGRLFFVNSFSGGTILPPFNRNLKHALATPPLTIFRLNIVEEDVSATLGGALFPAGGRVEFPPLIVSSLHQGVRLNNQDKDARISPIILIHEQPVEDVPAGDPGPT